VFLTKSRTLKNQLTETVALWGICFFLLLGLGIYVFFHDIETFLVDRDAGQKMDAAAAELTSLLQRRQTAPVEAPIRAELKAYTHDASVAAIALVEANGIRYIAVGDQLPGLAGASGMPGYQQLRQRVNSDPALYLFSRKLYGHPDTLLMVMDSSSTTASLTMTTEFTLMLMMVLLLISIKALHFVLGRRLVSPVDSLRSAMESRPPEDFAASMPQEIAQALAVYEQLQHRHDVMKMQFLNLMEALPGCFWWSEDTHHYAGISDKAETLLSSSVEDLTSARLWSWLQSPAQARINRQRLQVAVANREPGIDFAYQVMKGDQVCWFGETVTLSYNSEGELAAVYGMINDISSRKERQKQQAEKLELAQRMKATATLVGGIAHEFNNALAGMNGNLFLVKAKPDDPMTAVRIERIEKLIDHAATMIEQMLAFALQSNLTPSPVVMADFLRQFQSNVLPTIGAGQSFSLTIDDDALPASRCTVCADITKLQEALMQLIDNALNATAQTAKPEIAIRLSYVQADAEFASRFRGMAGKELVQISVSDNGCGMSEEVRKRIFEPFFTTSDVGQGTGLGLPMVYGYVRQLGGCIDVESREHEGAAFHLYLPLKQQSEDKENNTITHGHKETVLIIDDEQIFLDSCCEVLTELGYLTLAAHNGEEGVRIFRQQKDAIQLVITDIVMPGMGGVELYRRIQKLRPETPFLFITAYDQTFSHASEISEAGCEVLEKPFHIPALSQAIERAIRQRDSADI